MQSQKDAVVAATWAVLGNTFIPFKQNALTLLSAGQLESIKRTVADGILTSLIDYSKDRTNTREVVAYARSMVMNHMKKAKALNGGVQLSRPTSSSSVCASTTTNKHSASLNAGLRVELLSQELQDYVKTLG